MMAFNPTEKQKAVIDARTTDILVAAAAGSGKTAVLVERIMKRITDPDNPADIDEFLLITFTNDAAAQMRDRIRRTIDERLEKEPDNERLLRQSQRMNFASIMTIDSLCQKCVKKYFHLLAIDPSFSILDDADRNLLWEEAIDNVIEEYHEKGGEAFYELLDMYGGKRDDEGLVGMITELNKFSESHPFPARWLRKVAEDMTSIHSIKDLCASPCGKSEFDYVHMIVSQQAEIYEKLADEARSRSPEKGYLPALDEFRDFAVLMAKAKNLAELSEVTESREIPQRIGRKISAYEEPFAEYASNTSSDIQGLWKKWFAAYSPDTLSGAVSDIENCAPAIALLCELTISCQEKFRELMRRKNAYSFSEIQHMALDIFVRTEGEEILYTEAARQVRKQYKEIMVDEYQDCNLVQEMLFKAISGEEDGNPNLFLVGDIKQSIYRFRMARPELFTEKYERYSTDATAAERKLLLNRNFRSRKAIIDGVNQIFRKIMQREVGGVTYDNDAELVYGETYQSELSREEACNEYLLVRDNGETDVRTAAIQAVIDRIRRLTDPINGFPVTDKKGTHTARYSDIVILSRDRKQLMTPLMKALLQEGIPAISSDCKGYFENEEVTIILDLLRILDNPYQDIPFATVLQSPFAGFTIEELALLRIYATELAGSRKTDYSYCVLEKLRAAEFVPEKYMGIRQKGNAFLALYESLREKSLYMNVPELLSAVYAETGYLSYVTVMPSGQLRARNLNMLLEKAKAFTRGIFTELGDFVRYIERMKDYDVNPDSVSIDAENAVRFMTIHSSKGLEFPIVILIDADHSRKADSHSMQLHMDLGIGTFSHYVRERFRKNTFFRGAIANRNRIDESGENIRLLYVALTRAKEKLIVVGQSKKANWMGLLSSQNEGGKLYLNSILGKSYQDLILPSVISDIPLNERTTELAEKLWDNAETLPVQAWQIKLAEYKTDSDRASNTEKDRDEAERTVQEITSELRDFFRFRYSYPMDNTPVKVSVSELKMSAMEEYAVNTEHPAIAISHEGTEVQPVPSFAMKAAPEEMKGSLRGTLYHRILELHDYRRSGDEADSRLEAEQLVEAGYVQKELMTAVSFQKLAGFYQSEIGLRMKAAASVGKLKREQAFVMSVPADSVSREYDSSKKVLVQGIVDAFFMEDGGWVLLDYKTDHVPDGEDEQFLVNRYRTQLQYYAEAITRGTGIPVKETLIYSFALQKIVRL